ncbi:MAG: hypothetical protein ACHQ2Z_16220 [Elusimicrobiota bacterium]
MNKTSLLLAFAVAAFAGAASAQVANWDSPNLAAPCVGEMITAQPAPSAPASATAPRTSQEEKDATCADAAALDARSLQVTLEIKGVDQPVVLDYKFAGCVVEYPRDEPPMPAYAHRSYKTDKGDYLGVNSGATKDSSVFSIYLADGSSSATAINVVSNADLLSGRALDLGEYLMVKTDRHHPGQDGVVLRTKGTIQSVPAK